MKPGATAFPVDSSHRQGRHVLIFRDPTSRHTLMCPQRPDSLARPRTEEAMHGSSTGSTSRIRSVLQTVRSGGSGFVAELRSAVRQLRSLPLFVATAVGTPGVPLAMVMFAPIDPAIFGDLPEEAPDRPKRVFMGDHAAGRAGLGARRTASAPCRR